MSLASPQPQNQQAPVAPGGWSPTREGLLQVLMLFCDPAPGAGASHHQAVYASRELLKKHAEFTYYLSYTLMYLQQHSADVFAWIPHGSANQVEELRSRAGIELKNRIKDHWPRPGVVEKGITIDGPTREYVKATALAVLNDSSQFIRNIVGTIVTTICHRDGLFAWGGILEHLCRMLDSAEHNAMDGAFNALAKICEDMPAQLDSESLGRPLNYLLPKFITFFLHPHQDIRKYAIATVNVFLLYMPHALLTNIDAYMQNLFVLAGRDSTKEIRKRVCQAFVLLFEKEYKLLHPHIEQVVQFMLEASRDADEQVCLEACEFWSAFCESEHLDKKLLAKYLDHLVPVLLKAMQYSPMELAVLGEDDEDDQLVPDRVEDLKPRFHRSAAGFGGGGGGGGGHGHNNVEGDDAEDDEDAEDEEDDDDDWQDDEVSNWTLRKCAAAALDSVASVYRADLLPFLLPQLQAALNSRSELEAEEKKMWVVRESGVLALGAIAEGCFDGLREYLPQLVPHLITSFLSDKKPLVRSITCWTLSRYSKWIVAETIGACANDHSRYIAPLLQNLLLKVRDKNKKVQEAACSAFATLTEEARTMLVPYLGEVLTTLMWAFQRYQAKNMLIVHDALSTLAQAVHADLAQPHLIQILMPPLMHRWHVLGDNDRRIFPLLELLADVAQSLGRSFFVFAEPVFMRCVQIIEVNLNAQREAEAAEARNVDCEFPDKEFIVCALDLLSGLAEGLEENIEGLVGSHQGKLLRLLFHCMQDLDPDVRQSAFALLGDLAKTCMGHLRPHLAHILPVCATNLNPSFLAVCNNASWAIGEISIKAGSDAMTPFAGDIMRFLTPILLEQYTTGHVHRNVLYENASITIGRLAIVCAHQVAASLDVIGKTWMGYLTPLKENQEKEHAFRGLALAIQVNPMAIWQSQSFPHLAAAIASWEEPSPELSDIFRQLLHSYKQSLGPQWAPTFAQCDPEVRERCIQRYQL